MLKAFRFCHSTCHIHALDTSPSRLACPGIPLIQAKPCPWVETGKVEEADCGSVSLASGRLEEGGRGPETGAGKGDHIQAPGDRRLGVA